MEEFRQYEKLHIKYNEEYENIFFDLELLHKFGYSNWNEIHNIHFGRGFVIRERNSIEIKRKTKLLKRIHTLELLYSPLMFEPYKLIKDTTVLEQSNDFKLVALVQLEMGSFFKFRLKETEFDINNLSFHLNYETLHTHFKEQFITHLTYNGIELEQKKEDVACTGTRVIIL